MKEPSVCGDMTLQLPAAHVCVGWTALICVLACMFFACSDLIDNFVSGLLSFLHGMELSDSNT